VVDVLLITGPAGLVMGFYANGGTLSRIAFILLAVLWIFFTAKALIKAKQKDFKAHRNYMIRSYALTLSALTLRAWKYGITNTMTLPPMDVYRVVAWLGWVGNLLFAEWLIYKRRKFIHKKRVATNYSNDTKNTEAE
jgi:putative Mn2+ efflux pump MntP